MPWGDPSLAAKVKKREELRVCRGLGIRVAIVLGDEVSQLPNKVFCRRRYVYMKTDKARTLLAGAETRSGEMSIRNC